MFAKYYQDELAWLREKGRELADARPELARFLGEPGADPDVERLLEGFAFLTGRIREKLDDEFPEFTHGLMDMFCPHYLRPIPSMAILQVVPKQGMPTAGVVVPAGTLVDSVPIDGTRCRFRTTAPLQTAPVTLTHVELVPGHPSRLRLGFDPRPGRDLGELAGKPLRLHLAGDPTVSRGLFLCLCHYLAGATAGAPGSRPADQKPVRITAQPAGLGEEEAALPVPEGAFGGFRLVQEYFAYPARFLFVDLSGLEGARAAGISGAFDLSLELSELPREMPPVSSAHMALDCVPVVNLFPHDGDPVRVAPARHEYELRPSGADVTHYEIYSVDRVIGRARGRAEAREYRPFFAFDAEDRTDGRFYRLRRRESIRAAGTETHLELGGDPLAVAELETVSVELTCTNRELPTRLSAGDIREPAGDAPIAFDYRSLTAASPPVPPPLGEEVHWRLLSHLTLSLRALADRDSLCSALMLYDFRARVDRQARRRLENMLTGVQSVALTRSTRLYDGVPVRGTEMHVALDEEPFGGEGEAYLFGAVLSEFLAHYVALNSFIELQVSCSGHGEVFTWPARLGRKITL